MHERKLCLTFLLLEFILDHIVPKRRTTFLVMYLFSVEACVMASVILYYILRMRAKTFHEYSGTVPLWYLKTALAKTTSLCFSKMR